MSYDLPFEKYFSEALWINSLSTNKNLQMHLLHHPPTLETCFPGATTSPSSPASVLVSLWPRVSSSRGLVHCFGNLALAFLRPPLPRSTPGFLSRLSCPFKMSAWPWYEALALESHWFAVLVIPCFNPILKLWDVFGTVYLNRDRHAQIRKPKYQHHTCQLWETLRWRMAKLDFPSISFNVCSIFQD